MQLNFIIRIHILCNFSEHKAEIFIMQLQYNKNITAKKTRTRKSTYSKIKNLKVTKN